MKVTIPKQRTVFRWIHIIVSIPIYGYIFSPFDKIPQYAFPIRFIFSHHGPDGIVDVERPSRSTTCFETIGPSVIGQRSKSR